MYCPRCGTEASEEKRYCSACGLELTTVAEIVAGRFVAEPEDDGGESPGAKWRRWGTIVSILSLMIGCLIPIAVGLAHYLPIDGTLYALLGGLAGLALFGGGAMTVYGDSLPKRRVAGSPRAPELAAPATTNALPPARTPVSVPSVTEHTTRSLEGRDRRS